MASAPKLREGLSLEEFLELPEIDEQPYLEYIDGRIEAKVSPQAKHSVLTLEFCVGLNQFARPLKLGRAFPELRCTYEGRSIVPDIVFLTREHIQLDDRGEPVDFITIPPDIQIEIISPRQSAKRAHAKLLHATAHGCPLGWLVHPYRRTIGVHRPGQPPVTLGLDGVLEGEPVLPGLRLPVADVFGWLKLDL